MYNKEKINKPHTLLSTVFKFNEDFLVACPQNVARKRFLLLRTQNMDRKLGNRRRADLRHVASLEEGRSGRETSTSLTCTKSGRA